MREVPTRPFLRAVSANDEVDRLAPTARRALAERLETLVSTLTGETGLSLAEALDRVADTVGSSPELLWLAQAVLGASLPDEDDVREAVLRSRLSGTWAALAPALDALRTGQRFRRVEVLRGGVTCDVHTTAQSNFLSGIQRVVRETTTRWEKQHDLTFVGWTGDQRSLRRVKDDEFRRLFGRPGNDGDPAHAADVLVPWESTHLWVEVITDVRRTGRLLALARHSRNDVAVLGFDSIPVTSSVTVAQGMTSHFARGLAAVRRANRVGLISESAADEFEGVMAMGAGRRDAGPEVAAVPLAVAAPEPSGADLAEARAGLALDGVPMVLVVGSHEPRKNHLAVLHAAEQLWRDGVEFNLVLVGAGSWGSDDYDVALSELVGAGRPVQSIRALPDRLLWAAYRLAHCSVFPSLNEGYGLPVAESLAAGTPVITSDYGSMRGIAAPDGTALGAMLVDPRDDGALREALRTVLTDEDVHARLKAETTRQSFRTWDQYAEELWAFLVNGERPTAAPRSDDVR